MSARTSLEHRRTSRGEANVGLALSRTASAQAADALSVAGGLNYHLTRALVDMDNFSVSCSCDEQVLGGVLMSPAYIQHALNMEGKTDCGADISQAKLVIAKLQGPEPTFVPVTEAQLADAAACQALPSCIGVLAQAMSCSAVTAWGWHRVPAVVLVGSVQLNAEALAAAEAQGLPVSHSMAGPHPEEHATQLTVFLKQNKYPANRAMVMPDWGFAVFASSVEEAVAVFDASIRPCLAAGAGLDAGAAAAGSTTPKWAGHALAATFKRMASIMTRSQSEQAESPGAGGASPVGANNGGAAALSLPGTPLSAAPSLAVGMGPAPGALAAAGVPDVGSPPSCGLVLPDDIRKPPTTAGNRRSSNDGRIPSFVTGMRPW